ncbi:hypothetical protein TrVE_jg8743 [Triparma verrucosa]|uniref:UspA domain-containing protein n=1 Tax=Triparma verrucosa TaxID=1606542 RepID=A0A9W7ELG5_9STRA|nr:hypothetical protein TrVE_jg8743 [Triparma verrucosa]
MGNAALVQDGSAAKYKESKMALYKDVKTKLKEVQERLEKEQPGLGPEEFDVICSEELANELGVSEDLVKAIAYSATPKKQSRPAEFPKEGEEVPVEGEDKEVSAIATVPPAPLEPAPTLVDISSPGPVRSKTPEPEPDAELCAKLIKASSETRFHHFIVGMDGSAASMVAFKTALALRKAKGKFYALHVEDKGKNEYLPSNMKWGGIKDAIEPSLTGSIPPTLYSMECIQKSPSDTTKSTFVSHINGIDTPMYVCLGWVGRKGPKEDPTVLGSVSDVAMRSCSHPVIICKNAPEAGAHSFVVCVDSASGRGMIAFENIMSMVKQIDTVTVAYCYTDEVALQEVKESYEKNFFENGYSSNIKFHGILHTAGTPIYQSIADYINESGFTFTVVAPDPDLVRKEISVSEHLVKDCKNSNFIFIKVPKKLLQG